MRSLYQLILSAILLFSIDVKALDNEQKNKLSTSLKEIKLRYKIPAMAVAIIEHGDISYTKGFGYVEHQKNALVNEHTLFRIASISKLFTAQAVMQLVEKNKISLEDKIEKYLSIFANSDITIRQLLTHSSGLKDEIKPIPSEKTRTINDYLLAISGTLSTEVEDASTRAYQFEYSDTGFNVLGAIISLISGIEYQEYINKHILQPSKMLRSGFFTHEKGVKSEAEPTYHGSILKVVDQRPYDHSFQPSEGLVSSVYDLSQWLILTMNNDPLLLNTKSYQQMLIPEIRTSWGEIYMGLGWQVYQKEGIQVARHPGSIRGYKSLLLSYPTSNSAIIILTNASDAPRWEIAKLLNKYLN